MLSSLTTRVRMNDHEDIRGLKCWEPGFRCESDEKYSSKYPKKHRFKIFFVSSRLKGACHTWIKCSNF